MTTQQELATQSALNAEDAKVFADFEEIFDCTNKTFFDGCLKRPQFSFSRDPRVKSALLRDRYQSVDGQSAHGICLNSEFARSLGDAGCITLIGFSIAQLARADIGPNGKNGKPETPGYVDDWTRKLLLSIGLRPFAFGEIEERQLGYGLSVDLIQDGPFDLMCRAMLVGGFAIRWHERPAASPEADADSDAEQPQPKKQTRARFQCSDCGLIAHAKPSAHLLCGCNGLALECTI